MEDNLQCKATSDTDTFVAFRREIIKTIFVYMFTFKCQIQGIIQVLFGKPGNLKRVHMYLDFVKDSKAEYTLSTIRKIVGPFPIRYKGFNLKYFFGAPKPGIHTRTEIQSASFYTSFKKGDHNYVTEIRVVKSGCHALEWKFPFFKMDSKSFNNLPSIVNTWGMGKKIGSGPGDIHTNSISNNKPSVGGSS